MKPPVSSIPAFRPGDRVTVRPAAEILATLDAGGACAGLPFMPEMMPYIGREFVISRKLEKTCVDASPEGMREFRGNDVYFLEELRCDGGGHGNCGRACMLFWKSSWLQRADDAKIRYSDPRVMEQLRQRLETRRADGRYRCQSSDLDDATQSLGKARRMWKSVRCVMIGNYSLFHMIKVFVKPVMARIWLKFNPRWPIGTLEKTPVESLGLQPGDWVEVKSVKEIAATLDGTGKNRGLQFAYDLAWCCGRKFQVRSRLDHMVIERTGKYLDVRNTVLLDGVTCPCRCVIGGCVRADYIYWREIWLRRIPADKVDSIPDSEKGRPAVCAGGGSSAKATAGCCR